MPRKSASKADDPVVDDPGVGNETVSPSSSTLEIVEVPVDQEFEPEPGMMYVSEPMLVTCENDSIEFLSERGYRVFEDDGSSTWFCCPDCLGTHPAGEAALAHGAENETFLSAEDMMLVPKPSHELALSGSSAPKGART